MKSLVTTRMLWRRPAPHDDQQGQALIEYTLIMMMIVIACIAILGTLSQTIYDQYFSLIEQMHDVFGF